MITALDHVQLAAPPGSEDALRAFYAGALGLTELPKPPVLAARGGRWFGTGSVQLHLGIEADFRPARKAHPGLRVTAIDAFATHLTDHGIPVTWDDNLPGHRRFYAEDPPPVLGSARTGGPPGNRLEFLEPVSAGLS